MAAAAGAAVAVDAAERPLMHVTDVLGMCAWVRRSPTLDGQVPLRAAQGCQPLLEGNALGWQVVLKRPLKLVRGVLGWKAVPDDTTLAAHRAAHPWLKQHLDPVAWPALGGSSAPSAGPVSGTRDGVRFFTGLLVRPAQGVLAWVGPARNRRNLRISVLEHVLSSEADEEVGVPLVLEMTLGAGAAELTLQGELASVVPMDATARMARVPLEDAPASGAAHMAFYSPAYFEEKKGSVTTRYRRHVRKAPPPAAASDAEVSGDPAPRWMVVECGPREGAGSVAGEEVALPHFTPAGRAPKGFPWFTFRHPLALEATWDGHGMAVTVDAEGLASLARGMEARWRALFGAEVMDQHRGALWYFTRYLNLHPPAEPWFFVKPMALGVVPPGHVLWLEGAGGDGFDILRGVVRADRFHAMPAVFHLPYPGKTVAVRAGDAMLRAACVPAAWLAGAFAWNEPLAL